MILWIAQGFGVGRIPIAPGTFGSVVGLVWFLVLLASGSPWIFAAGSVAGVACSVFFCGRAGRILGEKDPGSVVLDEIAAVPLCFAGWLAGRGGTCPLDYFLTPPGGLLLAGVFLAFRLFDIWKPWPVRQSQSIPGGWGVTVDDLLAAVYVNLLTAPLLAVRAFG